MMIRLIQAQIHIITVLSVLSLPALAAENGWQRGSCLAGSGVYRWEGGDRYEGQCQNNYFEGRGSLTLSNGDRYEGQFSADQKHGQGIYYFFTGDRYQGQ